MEKWFYRIWTFIGIFVLGWMGLALVVGIIRFFTAQTFTGN